MNPFYARMVAKKYVLIVNETLFGFIYMMPGSKGLSPHELAHRWVKDLRTRPDMSIKVGDFCPRHHIIGKGGENCR